MGHYSHLLAVLLALADVPLRASAHPIVRASLSARQTNNVSDDDDEKDKDNGPGVAAITGTAIGAGIAFFAFCFIVFWVYKRGTKKSKKRDVERGDAQRDGQGRGPQRSEPQRTVAQPQPVHLPLQERSASESTASSSASREQTKERAPKRPREQRREQQQQRSHSIPTRQQQSPHRFAAELPASEEPRRPPMARIRGFNVVGPPLLPPPTVPPTRPLPPTPPPTHPLPVPPTQPPLPAPPSHPTPPPNHPLPPIPTPPRPARPDTPQLPPTRIRRPSRQNLTTAPSAPVTPPRLAPLNTNTKDARPTTRPRANTGQSQISPKTVVMPVNRPRQDSTSSQHQRPHTPHRQEYQQYQQFQQYQPQYQPQQPHQHQHHHHHRDQSQQTLIPSPDSTWSLSTFGAGAPDNHPAAVGTHNDRFPVSPETPDDRTGTVYVAFGERMPPQRTRKASVWTVQDSDWPVPLVMTRRQPSADGRPRQAGSGSLGR